VVITGDHGEAFADPHIQRGHGLTVYEEELRVPLVFWNPRLFPEGRRVETIGGHVDLNPTIAEVLGVPANPAWQGHSLLQPERPRRAFFMANISSDFLFGVREGGWKYSYNATTGAEALFELGPDAGEHVNRAADEAARCKALREKVAAWVGFEDAFLRGVVD
jgi:arylsulfatase A-like enzyme